MLARTRFGSRLRAAVDDPRVAAGLGIPVDRVFAVTFAVGSGLAGLGGALGAEVLGLDPTFPLKFMVYFLIVVRGGRHQFHHRPAAGGALVLGIADVFGKYYVPKLGAFIVYLLMIAILHLAAAGPVRGGGMTTFRTGCSRVPLAAWGDRAWVLLAVPRGLRPARGAGQRDRHPGAVRAVAGPDPGLCRHRLAGPCGRLLRPRAPTAALFAKWVMPDPLVGLAVGMALSRLLGA